MTTIAANRECMAADSLWVTGNIPGKAKKIYRVNGALVGIAGSVEDGLLFVQWYADGAPQHRKPDLSHEEFGALVLDRSGIYSYFAKLVPVPEYDDAWALGSGEATAIAALRAGMTPKEAVEMASTVDIHTGLPVLVERL